CFRVLNYVRCLREIGQGEKVKFVSESRTDFASFVSVAGREHESDHFPGERFQSEISDRVPSRGRFSSRIQIVDCWRAHLSLLQLERGCPHPRCASAAPPPRMRASALQVLALPSLL